MQEGRVKTKSSKESFHLYFCCQEDQAVRLTHNMSDLSHCDSRTCNLDRVMSTAIIFAYGFNMVFLCKLPPKHSPPKRLRHFGSAYIINCELQ